MRHIDCFRFGLKGRMRIGHGWKKELLPIVEQQEQLLEHVVLVPVLVFVFLQNSLVDFVRLFERFVEPN